MHIRATVVRKSLDILTEYEDSFATGLLFSVGPGHPSNRLLYADQKAYYLSGGFLATQAQRKVVIIFFLYHFSYWA